MTNQSWRDHRSARGSYLSFGTRRSSSVSNYGNTPIVMRRSISSNGELGPHVMQAGAPNKAQQYGSLRGVPSQLADQDSKHNQFGSLRGLPTDKRLSKFDEEEELEGKSDKPRIVNHTPDNKTIDEWDTASLDVGAATAMHKRYKPESTCNHNTDRVPNEKWKTQTSGESPELKFNGDKNTHLQAGNAGKSTESLTGVKKKKRWWFRRKENSSKDSASQEDQPPVKDIVVESSVALTDRASSDINLKIPVSEDSRSLHEEKLKSHQILLKGYSQKTLAGMNLSNNRLSGTSQSVTSRTSLTGSDILISDSSKSFMQYDLPRTSSKSSNSGSIADKVREGKRGSGEQQYHNIYDGSNIYGSQSQRIVEAVQNSSPAKAGDTVTTEESLKPLLLRTKEESCSKSPGKREAVMFGLTSEEKELPRVDVDYHTLQQESSKEQNVSDLIDKLQETNIDDVIGTDDFNYDYNKQYIACPPLSPDSRPIRPLHNTVSTPIHDSSSVYVHPKVKSSSSLSGQEVYPHSLMDRSSSSRLRKRLSSESGGGDSMAEDSDKACSKKSNIAYTLTFHDEPICVNLRTKSQSTIDNKLYVTPVAQEGTTNDHSSETELNSENVSAPTYERHLSTGDERETSPGYRLAYSDVPIKSPTTGRRGLRKNPRVTREKDRQVNRSISVPDENTDFSSAQSSPRLISTTISVESKDTNSASLVNGDHDSSNNIDESNSLKFVEVESVSNENYVNTIKVEPVSTTEILSESSKQEEFFISNTIEQSIEKPVSKLKRRNTFTLSSRGCEIKKQENSNKANDRQNDVADETNISINNSPECKSNKTQQLPISNDSVEDTNEKKNGFHSSSPQSGIQQPRSYEIDKSPHLDATPISNNSPKLTASNNSSSNGGSSKLGSGGSGGGSRIPVMRASGGKSGGGSPVISKIPTAAARAVTTSPPERSSMRKKNKQQSVSASEIVKPTHQTTRTRKQSIVDESVAVKLGSSSSAMQDNFIKIENNVIVVKRETILELAPEAKSAICSVM